MELIRGLIVIDHQAVVEQALKDRVKAEQDWIDTYHDTDKEVYSEIIFSMLLKNAQEAFLDETIELALKSLYQRLMEATEPEEIVPIKQEFHRWLPRS